MPPARSHSADARLATHGCAVALFADTTRSARCCVVRAALRALPGCRARTRCWRTVLDAGTLGGTSDDRTCGIAVGVIVTRPVRSATLAHAGAGGLATDRLTTRGGFAAIRIAIRIGATSQSAGQAAAATRRALKAGASEAARVLVVQHTDSGLFRRIAALTDASAGRVAAHAVDALVAGTLGGRATELALHQ
jgi:hypothetical protein